VTSTEKAYAMIVNLLELLRSMMVSKRLVGNGNLRFFYYHYKFPLSDNLLHMSFQLCSQSHQSDCAISTSSLAIAIWIVGTLILLGSNAAVIRDPEHLYISLNSSPVKGPSVRRQRGGSA
jgi:hypothetical protein